LDKYCDRQLGFGDPGPGRWRGRSLCATMNIVGGLSAPSVFDTVDRKTLDVEEYVHNGSQCGGHVMDHDDYRYWSRSSLRNSIRVIEIIAFLLVIYRNES